MTTTFIRETCPEIQHKSLINGSIRCGCIQYPLLSTEQKCAIIKPLRKMTPAESHLPEYGHNTRQVILDYLYGSPAFQKWQTSIININKYIKFRRDGQYNNEAINNFKYGRDWMVCPYIPKMRSELQEHKDILDLFEDCVVLYYGQNEVYFRMRFLHDLVRQNKLITCTGCNKQFVPWKIAAHVCL